ncbi:MAG: BrnT family toxin [Acetobacteraceae bacterium]
MEIEFDPTKDAANRAKHGVSLILGAILLENRIGEVVDVRRDYNEPRFNVFGLVAGRLFVGTFTMRGEVFRVISVRKASKQEQRRWRRSE